MSSVGVVRGDVRETIPEVFRENLRAQGLRLDVLKCKAITSVDE